MALTDSGLNGVASYAGVEGFLHALAEACQEGDLLHLDSDGTVKLALATVGTAEEANYVAGQAGGSGDVILCYPVAYVDGRFSANTIGGLVYLAEATSDGDYTQTAPSTSGDVSNPIGRAITATRILAWPGYAVRTTA